MTFYKKFPNEKILLNKLFETVNIRFLQHDRANPQQIQNHGYQMKGITLSFLSMLIREWHFLFSLSKNFKIKLKFFQKFSQTSKKGPNQKILL